MSNNESLNTLLLKAVKKLSHSDTKHLDAAILLCHVLDVSRSYLYAWPEKILTAKQIAQLEALLTRRIQGEPIAYITGHKAFWSLDLQVTEKTLIPRPETELLVEQALARLPLFETGQVIDLGTGSGAIALAIAKERPKIKMLATDHDTAALMVAQNNAQRLGLHQVKFLISDWYTRLGDIKATLIVSNPPYIAADDPHLSLGDVQYEPRSALIGGEDGLSAIRTIIAQSFSHLLIGGWLLLEQGYDQTEQVQALFKQYHYDNITTYSDLAGLPRVLCGQKRV
ncbi:MAG: peptide chain release factor N(5)-glutamine methyltransferase [Candidatus Parabeggiatoa sp. nov. 3]|nr:MAG: peptide chain release factor N(5)-glutamine methyltransferase [Gammaproteobacteria bacterium]RKZ60870.1 MAG: peptide chain release factor N(5)-glutamine methyltransferase [Gammaproteobacteria bacterium]RKZ75547.1 MAG: peptide chain release factor N(5)-glutamine methyltransferase [Gammaproteobacteria bacterium]